MVKEETGQRRPRKTVRRWLKKRKVLKRWLKKLQENEDHESSLEDG